MWRSALPAFESITSAPTSAEKVARGHLLLVQESRFRLFTDDGKGLLLTLAHNANVDAEELQRYQRERTHVEVRYKGDPDLVSGVAHRVAPTA